MIKSDYVDQLLSLMPPGDAWPRDTGTVLSATLQMPAGELARADGRGDDLVNEADPRTTGEMLTDWEDVAGLPDPCTGPLTSFTARRARLVQKLTSVGDQSRAYFIGIATSLGYVGATITEYFAFTCDSVCTDTLYTDPWCYAWRLNIHETTLERDFTANSGCSEYLRFWGDTVLECLINQLKPAHTQVIFAYGV
jgi:uncharacterized protein YmfQ (DUF2313 family)